MAQVTVSRLITAPQEDVWAVLSDVANARKWNKSWRRIQFTTPQTHGTGTRFRASMGDEEEAYEFEVCEWSAPERIAFCPVVGPLEAQYSISLVSHVFELTPTEEGTVVELTANARPHGIRGRVVAMFFWPGHQKEGLESALDGLSDIFDHGDDESEDNSGSETLTE